MLDLAGIRKLLDAFERSDWDDVHLVADGVEVHISTSALAAPAAAAVPAAPAPAAPAPAGAPAATSGRDAAEDGKGPASAPAPDAVQMNGAHPVVSPSPGIFWRSPAPGEPPFVEVGQEVTPETPIGIVEVMKLMNQVLAGVSGRVVAVLAENGARVDRDEPMVLIEPVS